MTTFIFVVGVLGWLYYVAIVVRHALRIGKGK